jgi:hypothetical protein
MAGSSEGGTTRFHPVRENKHLLEGARQPTNQPKQNKTKTSWHWNSCKKKREFIYSATAPFCLIHLNILKNRNKRNTQNIKKENDIWWKCDIIWRIVDLLLVLFCVVSRGDRLLDFLDGKLGVTSDPESIHREGWHALLVNILEQCVLYSGRDTNWN